MPVNAPICSFVKSASLSDAGKCVKMPSSLMPGSDVHPGDRFESARLGDPGASHAGIDLDVERADGPQTGSDPGSLLDEFVRGSGGGEIVLENAFDLLGENGAQDEYRKPDAGLAELPPLVESRDPEDIDAAFLGEPGDADRPVPVRVRLHDEEQGDARGNDASRAPQVMLRRVEIDLHPCRKAVHVTHPSQALPRASHRPDT